MYLTGRIKKILKIQEFRNNFKKRSLILITEEQYPQNIIIDFIQDKIELLNYVKINDKVKIYINIKGREWINKDGSVKYFNTIQAWKIEKINKDNVNNYYNSIDEDVLEEYDDEIKKGDKQMF
ncbi:MAG: DUF3127 domain-containing protein [Candidatus Shikimatogenerans bostrichidophilus]|nr:MAG: DUF3127 domain-containing protein [Candidatus Shikimatogenerans bostrichidophilus]